MNIILRELKSIRRSLIIWSGSIFFLIYVGMIKYEGFSNAGNSANELMDSLPDAFKAIMGLGELNLALISGYYVVFFFYFALLGGVHAIMQGSVVLSKEERDKTADFLLVKPVKRKHVITCKIIASLIAVVIFNLVTWIGSLIAIEIFNDGPPINDLVTKLMISLLFMQLIFFSLGLLMGAITRTTKKATGISTAILLGSFLLSVIIDLYEKIDFLKYVTPFKYFDGKMVYSNGIEAKFVTISIVVILISVGLTYFIYQKKDLHV